jgi:hypothetical protein
MLNCYENKPNNKPPRPRGSTTINIKRKCTSMREVRASGPLVRSMASKLNIKKEDSTNNATTNASTNLNTQPHPTQPLNGDGYRKFLKVYQSWRIEYQGCKKTPNQRVQRTLQF